MSEASDLYVAPPTPMPMGGLAPQPGGAPGVRGINMGQHPQQLQALLAAVQASQRQGAAPTDLTGGAQNPAQLSAQRGGVAPPPQNALPAFPGGKDPGVYATPAPFNPFQAAFGGMGGATGGLGAHYSRAPMGAFDLAQDKHQPGRLNPYMSR